MGICCRTPEGAEGVAGLITEELRLGSEGPEVKAWQRFLNSFVEAGVLVESCRLTVDGKFGSRTHLATLAYQIRETILLSPNNGGDGAGVVGPLTQNHVLKQSFPPSAGQGVFLDRKMIGQPKDRNVKFDNVSTLSAESISAVRAVERAAIERLKRDDPTVGVEQPGVPNGSSTTCSCCSKRTERWGKAWGVVYCPPCWSVWNCSLPNQDVECDHDAAPPVNSIMQTSALESEQELGEAARPVAPKAR